MARKYIGRISSGGVIALCAILLLAPTAHSQTVRYRKQTFTISGNVGLAGVTMQGLPGAPTTDQNGVYSVDVEYGWSGQVTPVKLGYTFDPPQRLYKNVTEAKPNEDYQYTLKTYVISGSTGEPGVKLNGLPGDPVSDQAGRYSAVVDYGWSNIVTPEKEGYQFEPSNRMYTQVAEDQKSQDYKAAELKFVISGSAERGGVVMEGLPGNPKTKPDGTYSVEVGYGWDGTVTPTKPGHEFIPATRTYADVMEPQTNQNYQATVQTFQITGSANMAGVVMTGLPGEPISDTDGFYTAIVEYGWSGKVTPERPGGGYTFDPPHRDYSNVTQDYENQNYDPSVITLTISGNTGVGNVKLIGLDNVVSDATGFYSTTVNYGWTGSITPEKEGYIFDPATEVFAALSENKTKTNFKAERLTFEISGSTGIPGVILDGLPGRPVSGADGSYSVSVNYNFSGTVTPRKPGYTFEPEKRVYEGVMAPQFGADFTPSIIQHTIQGEVVSDLGPVEDVFIVADGDAGTATTDAEGKYEILVDHGWTGSITPTKDGYTFAPPSRSFSRPIVTGVVGQSFSGNVQMLTITDGIMAGDEPIADVVVTANPGGMTTKTDTKGKYSIQVPYGWTGELTFNKPGFIFEPNSVQYTQVTANINNLAPTAPPDRIRTAPPDETPAPPSGTTSPDEATSPPPDETAPGQPERVETPEAQGERRDLEQRLDDIRRQLDQLINGEVGPAPVDVNLPPAAGGPPVVGPTVDGVFREDDLKRVVLPAIAEQAGVRIETDATIKATRVSATLRGATVPAALQKILENTGYTFKEKEDGYLVFRPVTNTFLGDPIREALQQMGLSAGVTIALDENVTGEAYADLTDVPIEEALEIVLAGTPYVVIKKPNYFIVALRDPDSGAFPQISVTRQYHANYTTPARAKSLLAPAFAKYVQTDNDPNSHLLTVTATPEMAERIIEDIKRVDLRPRHVLLDARIVSMERGDLLNLGIDWGFPTARAGVFGDAYVDGDRAAGDVSTDWPFGIQVGFSFDRTFTDSLVAAINLLKENSQADIISSPQVLAQDGKMSEIRVITEENYALTPPLDVLGNTGFFTQTEFQTIESGTTLSITPLIGDNNDITLQMAIEVSDSIPSARGTQLPVVTRRQARNAVTIRDGGTVALAGLTENRSRSNERKVPGLSGLPLIGGLFKNDENDKATREIAVFVTARLVPDQPRAYQPAAAGLDREPGRERSAAVVPAGEDIRLQIRESLSRQQ